MKDQAKTKKQLLVEISELRRRLSEIEGKEEECNKLREEIRKGREKFISQYRTVPLPLFIWQIIGEDFELRHFNEAASEITKGKVVNFLGKRVSELYQDSPEVMDGFQTCIRENVPVKRKFSYRFRSTGETRRLQVSYVFVPPDLVLTYAEDVTRPEEMEKQLERIEEEQAILLNTVPAMIFWIDKSGKFVRVNEAFARALHKTPDEIKGKSLFDLYPEELAREYHNDNLHAIKSRAPIRSIEEQVETPDGTMWVRTDKVPYTDENGEISGIIGFSIDITDRKRIEEALRRSQEKYRSMVENINDVIFTLNPQGYFTYISPVIERVSGYRPGDVIGQHFSFFVYQDDIPALAADFERTLSGHIEPAEFRAVARDGTMLYLRISSRPLYENGQLVGLTGIMTDITEKKHTEEALKETEENYQLLAENITDIIWTSDLDLNLTYISPSVKHVLGYSVEEAMAQSVENLLAPDSLTLVKKVLAEELKIEETKQGDPRRSRLLEVEINRKDVSRMWAEVKIAFLRDQEGAPLELVGVARDITERKQSEKEREILQKRLEDALTKVLSGFIPICANCKKIRDENGNWKQIELYIQEHSEAKFSHGICPECAAKLNPKPGDK